MPRRGPVYSGLVEDLRRAVVTGTLSPGSQIPSEAALGRQYGISRVSVRHGLSRLAQEGLIWSAPGRGSFVSPADGQGRPRRISVVVPYLNDMLCARIVAGISRQARELGWDVMLSSSEGDISVEAAALKRATERNDDGVIVFPVDERGVPDCLTVLRDAGKPTVLLDCAVPGFDVDVVESDHRLGAYTVVRHLLRLGHRNLAFLSPDNLTRRSVAQRLIGFRQALQESAVAFHPRNLWLSPMFVDDRETIADCLCEPGHPTAVFAANDILASQVIALAGQLGISVPAELSVAGFDGVERTAEAAGLTTVRQPAEELGSTAVRALWERLTGRVDGPGRRITLRVELRIGSTAIALGGALAPTPAPPASSGSRSEALGPSTAET